MDIMKEQVFRLSEGKKHLPVRLHPNTLRRWITIGIKSKKDGARYFLEAKQVGGSLVTSVEAFLRFVAKLK